MVKIPPLIFTWKSIGHTHSCKVHEILFKSLHFLLFSFARCCQLGSGLVALVLYIQLFLSSASFWLTPTLFVSSYSISNHLFLSFPRGLCPITTYILSGQSHDLAISLNTPSAFLWCGLPVLWLVRFQCIAHQLSSYPASIWEFSFWQCEEVVFLFSSLASGLPNHDLIPSAVGLLGHGQMVSGRHWALAVHGWSMVPWVS